VHAPPTRSAIVLSWFFARLREFVTLLVLGALALWMMPSLYNRMSEPVLSQPLFAGLWGVLVAILGYGGAIFVVILVSAITFAWASLTLAGLATTTFAVGMSSLGLAFTVFSILVAYGSKLVVIYPVAGWMLDKSLPAWKHLKIVPLTLGILVYVLLSAVPWFGTLLSFIVTLVGLGSIWMALRERIGKRRSAAPTLVLTPA
jgi:hypothetical protein